MRLPEDVFQELRPKLTGTSYQILGSWTDAEDVVQDTWLKWERHHEEVESPLSWLTTVAVRASIDTLRARQARRESYHGEWLPEPISLDPGPEDVVTDRSGLSLGMLVMMESLSPLERAAFVLRQAFSWPYDEIAEILDRSPEAARQLDHRARRHLASRPGRFQPDPAQVQLATERFLHACAGGNVEELIAVLAPDVVLHSDGGGEAKAPPRQIRGARKVARFFMAVAQPSFARSAYRIVDVNGLPGLLKISDGKKASVISCDVVCGRITDVYLMAAPSKIALVRHPEGRIDE
jgi:RNA polymerase sigma-70 factor (ECF subfamily)